MIVQHISSISDAFAAAAAAAQADILRGRTPLQVGLAVMLTQTPAPPAYVAEGLWAVAGLQLALGRAFAVAWQARGRAVVETTFKLHALLGQEAAQSYVAEGNQKEPVERPYAELLQTLGQQAVWRSAALRWIDIYNQRLTLHRYSDPRQRRLQAELLFLLPLDLLLADSEQANWTTARPALADAVEQWLATWDLLQALAHAQIGWNRIEPPHALQLGGLYGLADEARPPALETISLIAGQTGEKLQEQQGPLKEKFSYLPWLSAAADRLQSAAVAICMALVENPQLSSDAGRRILQRFLGNHIPRAGWLRRFKDLLTSRA